MADETGCPKDTQIPLANTMHPFSWSFKILTNILKKDFKNDIIFTICEDLSQMVIFQLIT